MKIYLCCTAAAHYFTAAFAIIQQVVSIPGQLPMFEPGSDSLSSIIPEVP
jgi:hypothetical protein